MTDAIGAEIDKLKQRAHLLEQLRAEFPDLHEYHTRWRKVLVSQKVNESWEAFHTGHSCGCCSDAPWQAWFYAERLGEKVYSDPPFAFIGEKDPYAERAFAHRVDDGWEESVRKVAGDRGVEALRPRLEAERREADHAG
jgi:hypothetical protein